MFFEDRTEYIYILKNKKTFSYPVHLHHNIEVTMCLSGEIHATCNGKSKTLHRGDFLITFHNDAHSYGISENAGYIMLFFNPDISEIMKSILTKHAYENFGSSEEAIPVLDALCEEFNNEGKFSIMYGYLHTAIGMLLKNLTFSEKNEKIESDLFTRALKYISQNYTTPLSLKSVAKHLGVDPCHLSREFSKKIPNGFYGYLQELRIEKAKDLLKNTDLSIYEVLLESGFSNQRTFNRVFKNLTGCTPKDYRYK